MKRALVTGGAGLIGSHIVDLLLREGWSVRILDNLEPQTHRLGRPAWVAEGADLQIGYMPEMAKYVHVNSLGTAQLLELIRDENLPVRKVIVASSQAVYQEGAADC